MDETRVCVPLWLAAHHVDVDRGAELVTIGSRDTNIT